MFIVRWGGEPTAFNEEQWGKASASVSDTYISAFVDGALYEALGTDYEVRSRRLIAMISAISGYDLGDGALYEALGTDYEVRSVGDE